MDLFIIFLLVIVILAVSIGVMLGEVKPTSWGTIGGFSGMIYAYCIETQMNFSEYILTPAWEVITGVRTPGIYEIGAIFLLIAMFLVGIIALYNAIVTWTKDKPIALWR